MAVQCTLDGGWLYIYFGQAMAVHVLGQAMAVHVLWSGDGCTCTLDR